MIERSKLSVGMKCYKWLGGLDSPKYVTVSAVYPDDNFVAGTVICGFVTGVFRECSVYERLDLVSALRAGAERLTAFADAYSVDTGEQE